MGCYGEGGYLALPESAVTNTGTASLVLHLPKNVCVLWTGRARSPPETKNTSMSSSSAGGGAEWLGP